MPAMAGVKSPCELTKLEPDQDPPAGVEFNCKVEVFIQTLKSEPALGFIGLLTEIIAVSLFEQLELFV